MKKRKIKQSFILKASAFLCYTLGAVLVAAGIVGVNSTQNDSFQSTKVNNTNMNKTVSTKDLMTSVKRITDKIEAEKRAKRIAAEKARREKAEQEALKAAQTLATTAPKGEIQQYAHDLVTGSYGWTESDFSSLVNLWNRESGWNPKSHSASGACGIPQALPCSKIAASYGSNTWQNQVKWGLRYISGKYGSPSKAWATFQSQGWY